MLGNKGVNATNVLKRDLVEVISMEELDEFSGELKETVKHIVEKYGN